MGTHVIDSDFLEAIRAVVGDGNLILDKLVLEYYSTDAFVEGFIRFSCRFGYPKTVLPDEGSQLVKGCKDVEYSFIDSKQGSDHFCFPQYFVEPTSLHFWSEEDPNPNAWEAGNNRKKENIKFVSLKL